ILNIYRNVETADGVTRLQYDAHASVMDMNSGTILGAADGASTVVEDSQPQGGVRDNPDSAGIMEAFTAVFPELQASLAGQGVPAVNAPKGPCGDVHVEHLSGRRVGESIQFRAGFEG